MCAWVLTYLRNRRLQLYVTLYVCGLCLTQFCIKCFQLAYIVKFCIATSCMQLWNGWIQPLWKCLQFHRTGFSMTALISGVFSHHQLLMVIVQSRINIFQRAIGQNTLCVRLGMLVSITSNIWHCNYFTWQVCKSSRHLPLFELDSSEAAYCTAMQYCEYRVHWQYGTCKLKARGMIIYFDEVFIRHQLAGLKLSF